MPALSDRTFNPKAWARLALIGVALLAVAGLVWASSVYHRDQIEAPRLLEQRFNDPPGRVGPSTSQVSHLGKRAVETLVDDLKSEKADERSKALELLSTIDDPRVIPALGAALGDRDLGVQVSALAGLARTRKTAGAVYVWPLLQRNDPFIRQRAMVTLGLVGSRADAEKLLKTLPEFYNLERYLLAWSAGRILRRLELGGPTGYLAPPPDPGDDEGLARIHQEVLGLHAALDALQDVRATAMRLSALTDVNFATWDYAHQISAQVIAVGGPLALLRGVESELTPPRPTQRRLELDVQR